MGKEQHINHPLWNFLYQYKEAILNNIQNSFLEQNLVPQAGIELEFYLLEKECPLSRISPLFNSFVHELSAFATHHNIKLLAIEQEQGHGQIEIKTYPYFHLTKLCSDLEQLKEAGTKLANQLSLKAIFAAQPFKNDCGNALQINLSLWDKITDHNLFAKKETKESELILHSIGGIIKYLSCAMLVFAPLIEDYERFNYELNYQLFKKKKYTAPVNSGWGYNNRSTAIRIPSNKDRERRLEFRVPSGNSDSYLALAALLLLVKQGITHKLPAPPPIYGNAFDKQYQLPTLPDYKSAQKTFFESQNLIAKQLKHYGKPN